MGARHLPPFLAAGLALLAAGCGLHGGRLSVLEENDFFNIGDGLDTDRDYTQGTTAGLTLTDADTPGWARDAARAVPLFSGEAPVHLGFVFGQELYTPEDLTRTVPDPDDRPYAAWLHAGLALQSPVLDPDAERRRDRLDHLQLDLGVVGPSALGEQAQNRWHERFDIAQAQGWDSQIPDAPAVQLSWESRWRMLAWDFGGSGWRWDALPRVQARAGTVRVDATAGVTLRLGWDLPRDFGPMVLDSYGLSPGFAPHRLWYGAYGSLDVTGVAYNVFLDGIPWEDGPSVTSANLVRGTTAGVAAGYGPFSATFAQVWLTPEFRERRRYHRTTTMMVSWAWFF